MEQLLITVVSLCLSPLIGLLFLVVILASFGKSLGIRKRYVSLLLRIFEFGKTKIAHYESKRLTDECDSENDEECVPPKASLNGEIVHSKASPVNLIHRDISLSSGLGVPSVNSIQKAFHLSDVTYFLKYGMEAIIEDEVTTRFSAEELPSWNLLTRTDCGYQFISWRLTFLWGVGFCVRYFILLPFRFVLMSLGIVWLIICTAFIGYLPPGRRKRQLNQYVSLMCARILARAISAMVVFHDRQNMVKHGICVANHTSPIDVIILSCDNCYALVAQAQGGLFGILQRALGRATHHVWFERSEVKDRHLVANRLKEHVENVNKLPMLIFPEGTCINNTSVMMFKKGSFEISSTIHPVAIKYDARFGDAFWNSSKHGMMGHLFSIMTSWAVVCDVWYLPPMTRLEGEDAVDFANRVKGEIARKGGLVDLEWDGQLKRTQPKSTFLEKQQKSYSRMLKVE